MGDYQATVPLEEEDDLFDDSDNLEDSAMEDATVSLRFEEKSGIGLQLLCPGLHTIGKDSRKDMVDITINNKSVSNKHAILEVGRSGEDHFITDLGSLNGTRVGHSINSKKNRRIKRMIKTQLSDGVYDFTSEILINGPIITSNVLAATLTFFHRNMG